MIKSKHEKGNQGLGAWLMKQLVVLNRVASEGLTGSVGSEQRCEGCVRVSQENI